MTCAPSISPAPASEISQITIVNRRINEDLLDSLRYQLIGDKYDPFREELNTLLESQIGRGPASCRTLLHDVYSEKHSQGGEGTL